MAHYELIVIGAGPGGYEAALHAAKLGKKVAVVEKREAGGTCLNRGCIPTKTLLHSSQIFHDAKHGAHAGIHTDDIRADMTEIFAYKREISQKLSSGIESLFKTAKIDFLRGTALITAPDAVRVTDAEGGANDYTCDDILIATEVGGGVVPMDPKQRADREAAGRLACLLAARAECVVQMFCGIPTVLKGELSQC